MNITIRSEKISDYNDIANVNYEAFLGWHPDNQYVNEALLVDYSRRFAKFDPELSLVAESEGKIVGHALFLPFKFIILGKEVEGVVLAPLAVHPKYQRSGIGGKLLEEGHKVALEKGYSFSLLCGHSNYYPRFGYKTKMFSLAGSKVTMSVEAKDYEDFTERPVSERDIPWILESWNKAHQEDVLALFPGYKITEWNNHNLQAPCSIVLNKGQAIGYIRYDKSNPSSVKELLAIDAADGTKTKDILTFHLVKHLGKEQGEFHLLLSEEAVRNRISAVNSFKVEDEQVAHEAFMIKVLDDSHNHGIIREYCDLVEKGDIKPGIMMFMV